MPQLTKGMKILIYGCVLIQLIVLIKPELLQWAGIVPAYLKQSFSEFYRLLSYAFVHDSSSPWHLVFNLIGLYFFGSPIESMYGTKKTMIFSLAAVIFGALMLMAVSVVSPSINAAITVGISGLVYAFLTFYILLMPEQTIYMVVFPIKAKNMLYFLIILEVFNALSPESGISWPVHAGGMVFGYLICKFPHIWRARKFS